MKKYLLICALGGMLMTACSSEDVVNPNAASNNNGQQVPMTFATFRANQGRSLALEDVLDNFGVWAIKGADAAAVTGLSDWANSENLVMENYAVIYDATNDWGYAGKGSAEGYANAYKANQFLKYWDANFTNTYFFAYAPYNKAVVFDNNYGASPATPMIAWPGQIQMGESAPGNEYMYSVQECNNNHYVTTPDVVNLVFKRLIAKVQIAFYENIPGYDVEITSVDFGAGGRGVVAIPTKDDYSDRGTYAIKGKPTVKFDFSGTISPDNATVSLSDVATSTADFDFAVDKLYKYSAVTSTLTDEWANNIIPDANEQPSNLAYSHTVYTMIPNNTNSAIQFVVNFNLRAKDTNEIVRVRGARVTVPATATSWAANSLYTYIFCITKDASGTTEPGNPIDDPKNPGKSLYPIIFDNMTVSELTTLNYYYSIN